MNEIIRNVSLKEECASPKKEVTNASFENCTFDHLILSDIKLENIEFINCKFDHVFIEAFYAKNILITRSEILSLSLRGNRKISSRRLFQKVKQRSIEEVRLEDSNNILELVLGGNLQVANCTFPKGDNYLHIKNPFLIYNKCLDLIGMNWESEKRKIGMIVMQDYISKEVEEQNEDFITYSYNDYLKRETNEILQSVFFLIKEVSESLMQVK